MPPKISKLILIFLLLVGIWLGFSSLDFFVIGLSVVTALIALLIEKPSGKPWGIRLAIFASIIEFLAIIPIAITTNDEVKVGWLLVLSVVTFFFAMVEYKRSKVLSTPTQTPPVDLEIS